MLVDASTLAGSITNDLNTSEIVKKISLFIGDAISDRGYQYKPADYVIYGTRRRIEIDYLDPLDFEDSKLILKGRFRKSSRSPIGFDGRITGMEIGSYYKAGRDSWGFTRLRKCRIGIQQLLNKTPESITNRLFRRGDTLVGRTDSSDEMYGFSGPDYLDGRGGFDDYWGGTGPDTFVLRRYSDVATIYDYNRFEDSIKVLDGPGLLSVTNYSPGETTLWSNDDIIGWIKGVYTLDQLRIF